MSKDKKKLIIIIAIVIAVLAIGGITLFLLNKEEKQVNKKDKETTKTDVVIPDAPAESTETLVEELEKIEVASLNNDVIEFSLDAEIEKGDKVAVWVYSKPKFLGYFEVILEDGIKVIKGLEKAMKDLKLDSGEHNLAIVTEEGKSIGYIDIFVDENKLFENETAAKEAKYTTKEVTEKEEIKFKTETKKDSNIKSGSKEVTQQGVNGSKEVTYKITYDETGKEIAKEKINEKITKQPVNEIIVTGTADFNTNTSMITTEFVGPMCTKEQMINYEGQEGCDDTLEQNFKAIAIDNTHYYVVTINNASVTPIKITKSGNFYTGTYKGTTYYFESRSGGAAPEPLTAELCSQYKFNCGAW